MAEGLSKEIQTNVEPYEYPLIMHSMQYFAFAEELADKIEKDKKILTEYPTIENEITFKRNLYIYYLLVADGTAVNASIAERNLEYQKDGWFIWLQNYNFTTSYPYKNNDELFTYCFDKYFDRHFNSQLCGGNYFQEAIENYKLGYYYACVCCLFPLIEYYERFISKFDGQTVFKIKNELEKSQIPNMEKYERYFKTFEDNLNKFLKDGIYAKSIESEQEPKIICRNRTLHGIFTRNISQTDCLKLFCIVSSMAQFNFWLKCLEFIKSLPQEIKGLETKKSKSNS